MSEVPPWWDDVEDELSDEAREIIEEAAEDIETEEDAADVSDEVEQDTGEDVELEVFGDGEEVGGELSDDAEYYQTFGTLEEAWEFAHQYPGVFVIVYDEDNGEYDVYRDYENAEAVA